MAKKQNKQVKQETLETILMNCRNSLRGRAQMTDKRDLLLTLVFLKFIGYRFKQQRKNPLNYVYEGFLRSIRLLGKSFEEVCHIESLLLLFGSGQPFEAVRYNY